MAKKQVNAKTYAEFQKILAKVEGSRRNEWYEVDLHTVPVEIRMTLKRQGHEAVKAETKAMTCSDGRSRYGFRIQSDSGRVTQWTPSTRALTAYDVQIVTK